MNIFKNKIIILTGCGYLGKSICESLHNSGGEILGLDINKKTNIKLNNFKYFKVDLSKNNEIDKFLYF